MAVDLNQMGRRAREAARILALASTEQKNQALRNIAQALAGHSAMILEANRQDQEDARRQGLSPALLDRLALDPVYPLPAGTRPQLTGARPQRAGARPQLAGARLKGVIADLLRVAELPDPVGEVFDAVVLPNGLRVHKLRLPLGVLGVIYEARPNVTVDVAGLAIKSGNAVILRGGKETILSNRALTEVIQRALGESGLPPEAVQLIADPDRALVLELLRLSDYVDMIIPRGGAALHDFCLQHSRIPVMTGGIGICHLYVDASADLEASLPLIENAKVQRPTVCNALDTLLVHAAVAGDFLPRVVERLGARGVTFRADPAALEILRDCAGVQPAAEGDFDTEWLSLVLGLKVVGGLDEAITHIRRHSTGHSDGILTADVENARRFIAEVDSAAVYVNASTRFTDGGQLGLGAEVAISTQRLHARGPMGLRELTTYKWVIEGEYHVRG